MFIIVCSKCNESLPSVNCTCPECGAESTGELLPVPVKARLKQAQDDKLSELKKQGKLE